MNRNFYQYCICLVWLLLALPGYLASQQVARSEYGTFALTDATIITVTDDTIRGDLLIANGRIAAVGGFDIPPAAKVINCSGMFIYPGFIDAGTYLGLSEIGSISVTRDANEVGKIVPQLKALTAVNPNSVLIPVQRVNGITTVLTRPSGGLFPGTAALINLHGYTPEQMSAGVEALILNFPRIGRRGRYDKRNDAEIDKDNKEALKELNDIWNEAVLYSEILADGAIDKVDYNPEMAALSDVVTKKIQLHIEVNEEHSILEALRWITDKDIDVVLTGVAEGWRVADSIAASKVPVITGPVLSYPRRPHDRYDAPYRNASVLADAGVKVAIRTNETENVRNLPYNAAFAATYGLGRERALKAITIAPAEILGVDDLYGSIEAGKVANVFVTDGDPFETKTQVRHLFINGWKVPLESRHTLLYEEFLERTPGLTDD